MESNLIRTATVVEYGEEIGTDTCERYGHTMMSEQVWWNPETKKKYLYVEIGYDEDEGYFEPYDGPVIHGSVYSF